MKQPESVHITPELIAMYRTWTAEGAAQIYDRRLRDIEASHAQTFTELGLIMVECESRELWKYANTTAGEHPKSFSAWIVDCLPVSNGSAFSAFKCAKVLSEMPAEEREEIPRGNQETMASMSTALLKDEVIVKAAKQLKPKEFREMVEREHPGQHIEAHKPLRFSPERSGRQVIDAALQMCMEIEECGRDEALEVICQLYVGENQVEYNKRRNSKTGVRAEVVQ